MIETLIEKEINGLKPEMSGGLLTAVKTVITDFQHQ